GEQQAAANRLAQRALGGLDFQLLLDEAAAEVCRLLHADVCEILELGGDRRELRRRSVAGAGAGESAALEIPSAAAGYFLRQSTPAAVDRASENDPLLDRYRAHSAAGVIFGTSERPYGILAVYSLTPRSFTQNQLEFLQSVAYTLRSALDRTAMEKRLREREHMESIGVLAGGVAHDFNNLLAIIMGNADEACRECSPCAPIRAILSATERAAQLTRQLLAYSGKGQFVSEPIDLSSLVADCADVVRRSVPNQVTFDFVLGENLPPFEADPNQVRQILMNLVTNAGEAIPVGKSGSIRIATGSFELTPEMAPVYSSVYGAAPGHYVSLEVTDNGCGIDEASRPRIFEPFFTTKFTGRGLGLAGVQGIVRAHSGFIQVDSAPGRGATFQVFFPASANNRVEAPASGKPASRPATARNVLVIDDEPALRRMVVRMLERLGFHALEAENGAQALELLAQSPEEPAVALLDVMMPIMGAAELLPVLRSRYPGLKVIATSGYPEQEARRVLRSEPVAGFLQKPYHREALHEMLMKALN
ncbi:MAG: response regulator, partial [Acidobacteriia bacterium]|nr:response regulator [Terriglobia bacterium]